MGKDRRHLVSVGVGASILCGLNSWKKPLVNSVVLPAHAITSEDVLSRLSGLWRVEYVLNPGIQPPAFTFTINSDGFGSCQSVSLNLNREAASININPVSRGITIDCIFLLRGNYNSNFDEIVGVLNIATSGADAIVATKV